MGGKNTTTQSTVSVPPEVLARYTAANQRAEQAAQQPFQIYSTNPNAFVAPLTQTQQSGIANTNAAAGQAQPYYNEATARLRSAYNESMPWLNAAGANVNAGLGAGSAGLGSAWQALQAANESATPLNTRAGNYYGSAYQQAQPYNQAALGGIGEAVAGAQPFNQQAAAGLSGALAGAQPANQAAMALGLGGAQAVNPEALTAANINQYMSPYLDQVLGRTQALLNQQNQIEQSGQTSTAIRSGAFGGDRAGIAAANLANQQRLANEKIYSDILNQGYGQALGTAQQQQGVGLGAAQANRAALQQAAGQIAGIGQQQYAQGTGTAQAQAGLGQQVYGQGLGAASAVQGLGQQVYGQGTGTGTAYQGLGQQVFGQGLSTSQQQQSIANSQFQQALQAAQQQAALGQQQYGMGAGTAESLAGLGAGAQGAALQGAQAQMGAGQAQQQTEQAGLQALYNQFLQQQSYPFQVAQFLANIAMGTGSLSGSTTTTTQPGGFFSDVRLKENVKEVGKTFDGQPIVTYRYKDDDPKVVRLGLIAQEVEKSHPDAVGEEGGFKTVHYGKATEDAAKRGHFASGGPILPGLSGSDMAALLAAQQQMYGPYGGGLYGGEASGLPHGGSSYVPQSTVQVSPLTVASPAAAPPSGLEQAAAIADFANDSSEGLGKVKDWWKKKHPDEEMASGGRARRASGGQLYGSGLDIPDERPDYELKTADPPGKPKSGLSQALDVAKVAAMFMADGGEVKKDDEKPAWPFGTMRRNADGSQRWNAWGPNDPPSVNVDEALKALVPRVSMSNDAAQSRAIAEARRAASREANLRLAERFGYRPPVEGEVKKPFFSVRMSDDAEESRKAAALREARARMANAAMGERIGQQVRAAGEAEPVGSGIGHGLASVFGGENDPARRIGDALARLRPQVGATGEWDEVKPTGLAAPRVPVARVRAARAPVARAPEPAAGLGQVSPLPDPQSVPPEQSVTGLAPPGPVSGLTTPDVPGKLSQPREPMKLPGYLQGLKEGNAPNWVSLLSGIAAMGTAPTVHPGVALAAGLGAGTRAYQGAKQTEAELAKKAAETATEKEQAKFTEAQAAYSRAQADFSKAQTLGELNEMAALKGWVVMEDPAGNYVFEGRHFKVVPKGSLTAKGATAVSDATSASPLLGDAGRDVAKASALTFAGLDQGTQAAYQKDIGGIIGRGNTMQASMPSMREWGASLSQLKEGPLQPGAFSAWGRSTANIANSVVDLIPGLSPEQRQSLKFDPEGLDAAMIAEKSRLVTAQARAAGMGQESVAGLERNLAATPNEGMTRNAALTLWAQEMVQAQRDIDMADYFAAVDQESRGVSGLAQSFIPADAMQAFNKDHPSSRYDTDRNKLSEMARSPEFTRWLAWLHGGDPKAAALVTKYIEKQYGRGLARYLTGQ